MLNRIKNALLALSQSVYHFSAPPDAVPAYLVWAEDSANDFVADGRHVERAFIGTIDLYTKQEDDPLMEAVQDKLDDEHIAWYLNSVQHEDNTGLIHYEWVWEAQPDGKVPV